jgi:hypothetical protein
VVATSINAERSVEALKRVRDLVSEHGSAEQQERLTRIMGGIVPAPNRNRIEHDVYTVEALAIALELFAELKEANRPKKRGRPRKNAAA